MRSDRNAQCYMAVEYETAGEGAAITGCFGDIRAVSLPEKVNDTEVTEIGAYAFSASREEKAAGKQNICEINPDWKPDMMGEGKRICGERLERLYLPPSVRKIGRYAFYGCLNLEVFHMTDGLVETGGGAFVGCRRLRRIEMEYCHDGAGCLKQVLEDVPFELEVELSWEEQKAFVVFPEFYEESVENTPARIIEIRLHGSGSHYRQCFQNGQLDFDAYDRLFPFAQANENPDVVGRIAFARLSCPHKLSPEAENRYLLYLREHIEMTAGQILERDDLAGLKKLEQTGVLTADNIQAVLELSLQKKRAECTAYLMSLPYHRREKQKKTFDL